MIFLNTKKRLRIMLFIFISVFFILLVRLFFVQVINGSFYKRLAIEQQNLDREISAKRGIIYDRNGEILAMSASSQMVTINPNNIDQKIKEQVAKEISSVLEIDYENVLKKVNKNS